MRWITRLAATAALCAGIIIPVTAHAATTPAPLIPGGNTYLMANYDFSQEVDWGPNAGTWYASNTGFYYVFITNGTLQEIQQWSSGGLNGCLTLNINTNEIQTETCQTGDKLQEWRSQNTSHGWLIWNYYMQVTYGNLCAATGYKGYEAVITVDYIGEALYLACPEGYTGNGAPWGLGQWWAAVFEYGGN